MVWYIINMNNASKVTDKLLTILETEEIPVELLLKSCLARMDEGGVQVAVESLSSRNSVRATLELLVRACLVRMDDDAVKAVAEEHQFAG